MATKQTIGNNIPSGMAGIPPSPANAATRHRCGRKKAGGRQTFGQEGRICLGSLLFFVMKKSFLNTCIHFIPKVDFPEVTPFQYVMRQTDTSTAFSLSFSFFMCPARRRSLSAARDLRQIIGLG